MRRSEAETIINLYGGPGLGESLRVQRTPLLLRVTLGALGVWDALDQLDDAPRDDERIYAYRRAGAVRTVLLDYTDRQGRRRGRTFATCSYDFVRPQPEDATLRDNAAWQAWAQAQAAAACT